MGEESKVGEFEGVNGLYFEVVEGRAGKEAVSEKFPSGLGPFNFLPTEGVRCTDLKFDADGKAWRANVQDLQTDVLKEHLGALAGELEGSMLERSTITFGGEEKAELGIPSSATRFAWGSLHPSSLRKSYTEDELISMIGVGEPDLCFLIIGGFLYFDEEGTCVGIRAVVPSGIGVLEFGGPKRWHPEWTEEYRSKGRFSTVLMPLLFDAGAREYMWINPEEHVGGKALCKHGAFVYLFPEGVKEVAETRGIFEIRCALIDLFAALDEDRSGFLEIEEITQVMRRLDEKRWTERRIKRLHKAIDTDENGKIQYSEFVDWLFAPGRQAPKADVTKEAASSSSVGKTVCAHEHKFDAVAQAAGLAKFLPEGKPRICILGGRAFNDPSTQPLVQEVARLITQELGDIVVALTGGLPGVQENFAKALGEKPEVVHMCPFGEQSGFGVGRDLAAGANMAERMEIYGRIGDVYVTFEGGPGVAKEAIMAHSRGAALLPMMWTGGASGGMFDFPPAALEQPTFCSAEDWAALKERGDREGEELVRTTAESAVKVIRGLIQEHGT